MHQAPRTPAEFNRLRRYTAVILAAEVNACIKELSIKGISPLSVLDAPIPWFSEVTSTKIRLAAICPQRKRSRRHLEICHVEKVGGTNCAAEDSRGSK